MRRLLGAIALLLAPISATAAPTTAVQASVPVVGDLNGTWEGTFETLSGAGVTDPHAPIPPIRIMIQDHRARVFMNPPTGMTEVMAGEFEIARSGTNAVVYGIQHDPDAPLGASWVETWTFTVTVLDADTLSAAFVRVVNNNQREPTEPGGRFTIIRTSTMRRVG